MNGLDLVKRVTPKKSYTFAEGRGTWRVQPLPPKKPREHHVVAVDFGVKKNILRCLVDSGCRVTVVPASTSAKEILPHVSDSNRPVILGNQ